MNANFSKIVELLDSSDLELRIAAIRVLSEIGQPSKPVIQALGRCLREPHEPLRLVALKALARLGASDVVSLVVPLVVTTGPLREQAMAVVAAVGSPVVPQLKQLYAQADFHGKRSIISVLGRIGGKDALTFLVKLMPNEAFEIQKHLTLSLSEALEKLTPAGQVPLVASILKMVRDKQGLLHPQILVTGAILLGHVRVGPLHGKVQAELKLLTDAKYPPEVRRHATLSLNRLYADGKVGPADVQYYLKAMCDDDWHNVAQHALSGFQRLSVTPQLLAKLVDLLHRSPHFSVHIHIFDRLKVSDRPEVADAILPFLADSRFRVREAAESALRSMPTAIESLFNLLMRTDDLEVTQRINGILRDFPQETRRKYVQRAVARLLTLFEENDPHYKSFLEFVKNLDPEPLRAKVYEKALALKRKKSRDRWERIASLVQLLWDHHMITAEGRYLLALALVKLSSKDLAPASRRSNLGLRVIRALIYDEGEDLVRRLRADKDLLAEDFYYLGFHFSEEGEELKPFARIMLEHVVKVFPKSPVAAAAGHKIEIQNRAAGEAAEAAKSAKSSGKKSKKSGSPSKAAVAKAPSVPAPQGLTPGGGSPLVGTTPAVTHAPQSADRAKAAQPVRSTVLRSAAVRPAGVPPSVATPARKVSPGKAGVLKAGVSSPRAVSPRAVPPVSTRGASSSGAASIPARTLKKKSLHKKKNS